MGNNNMAIDSIGYIASMFITASSVPQIYRIWQTKSAQDVSLLSLGMLLIGLVLWLVYAILRQIYPIIVSSSISITLYTLMFILTIVYKNKKKEEIDIKALMPSLSLTDNNNQDDPHLQRTSHP